MSSPFASAKTTMKWLDNLAGFSDYDMHHALVEGLERFNGDVRGDIGNRIKMLRIMEETGIPLQSGIISQYLHDQGTPVSARQSLWRECHLFWDQLTVAYLSLLKPALKGSESGKLEPWSAEVTLKSLRYSALTMRWEYFRGGRPSESAWLRLHKIYRMAEMSGVALTRVDIEGRETDCVQEYVRALLYDLANIYAFSPAESRLVMEILDGLEKLPVPEIGLRHDRHTHMVDLAAVHGPKVIADKWVPGNRLRYLELQDVLDELESRAVAAQDEQERAICKRLSKVISRSGAHRSGPRQQCFGEVETVFGADSIGKLFSPYRGMVLKKEIMVLRDESSAGLGFVLDEQCKHTPGTLFAVNRGENCGGWQLLAVRWLREEANEWLLGAESISKHPRRVEIEWEAEGQEKEKAAVIFLPLTRAKGDMSSNLLLPHTAYALGRAVLLRDDGSQYRLKLGEIIETHESWLRVGFDVLSRQSGI